MECSPNREVIGIDSKRKLFEEGEVYKSLRSFVKKEAYRLRKTVRAKSTELARIIMLFSFGVETAITLSFQQRKDGFASV